MSFWPKNWCVKKNTVSGCIVMMEHPNATVPQFRSFVLYVLHQMPQSGAVELGIGGLTEEDKFMVYYCMLKKKYIEEVYSNGVYNFHKGSCLLMM